jgi:hypothetical protein
MKRGISTIIGTLVFMIIIVSTFSSILLFIQYQNDLLSIHTNVLNKKIDIDRVDIITSNYCNANCKLTVGVYNDSDHDINILSLWLIDNRTSNVIIQRDMDTHIMSKRVAILLNEYSLQGGIYTIKVVTNDGSIKEKTINIPSLELNLKAIITPSTIVRGGNATILAHITNIGDGPVNNINVYITGIGNRSITIATIDRLERLQSTVVTYEINNINNNLTISIYAEGTNQLGKIIRSNVETKNLIING